MATRNAMDERACSTKQAKPYANMNKEHFAHSNNTEYSPP